MEKVNKFRCVIIGGGTLPILCAQVLLNRDHEICSIISSDVEVQHWTREREILHHELSANLAELLSSEPFDYLFSVNNEQTLREDVLNLPRKLAINYHHNFLPACAGTHVTSRALMNEEIIHGISWHLMAHVVDAGDILKQQPVEIGEGDTAITLNRKCYEAAINSFTQLVDDLESESVVPRKQISLPELVASCGLHSRFRFTDLDCTLAKRAESLYAATSKH